MISRRGIAGLCAWLGLAGGCGDVFPSRSVPLFSVPLVIEGKPVGTAIIDTGGGYELMLRDSFGLNMVGTTEVLAFGGTEEVGITEGFRYAAGGWSAQAESALVGLSVCDCNGLGFYFFQKTGAVLALDFENVTASFVLWAPGDGVVLPFQPPPTHLTGFDSAFIEVEVQSGGDSRTVLALLDTGTNASVLRRRLVGTPSPLAPNIVRVTIAEPQLGTVWAQVGLFDVAGLPDMILGTDVMRAWADRWYISFASTGGTMTVFPRAEDDPRDGLIHGF
jgi:hypothetical protein